MTILALDTSSRAASCALWRDGALLAEFFLNAGLTHSQTVMPMVRALLDAAGETPAAADLFAVSAGPGSFTGLRIGIAAVKGMAQALEKPCAAVSTLEALAENLAAFDGIVLPVMDARRSQMYTAAFRCGKGAVARLGEDAALDVAALGERIAAYAPEPVMLVGDGARKCLELLAGYPHLRVAPENLLHQRAGSVAAVAARLAASGAVCSAGELTPAYLRLPQAERERLARLER